MEESKTPEQLAEEAAQKKEEEKFSQEPGAMPKHDLSGLDKKPKKKFPVVVFILIMLVGFMCLASTAVWIEGKHNKCVVKLHECNEQCKLIPQEDLTDGGIQYDLTGS